METLMRRTPLAVLALMTTTALAACGDDRPASPASPATPAAPASPAAHASPADPATPASGTTPQQPATPAGGMQGGTDDWRQVAKAADALSLIHI